MIDQIIRFLDSYDLDDSIRQVWLDSHSSIFSKGTDLKCRIFVIVRFEDNYRTTKRGLSQIDPRFVHLFGKLQQTSITNSQR